jgi:hypothetical protein
VEDATVIRLETVGEIIAIRKLILETADGRRSEITVSVGKPERMPDSDDYYCPVQLIGLGDEKVRFAAGADAVQALQLAMQLIGIELYIKHKDVVKQLTWEGNEDLGFPLPEMTSQA